ncbi:MAG: DUF2207 domain-containing protein [Actinobacteria bacterium]|nr:DUF2207 domain-containing protein [Actinomycetota bacterium]
MRARPLLTLIALGALLAPASAAARSSDVTEAAVEMRVGRDAALLVSERLTFSYDGSFQASYRDILLKKGEQMSAVSVREGARPYRSGGCTSFGCTDAAGSYGATLIPGGVRVVWHHKAADEARTFTVSYRVEDAIVAYRDLLDLEWQVWGDQWDFDLGKLVATVRDPALRPHEGPATPENPSAVWGKPRDVEGRDFLEPGEARLEAEDVSDHQFVEMRVLIPRTPGQDVSAARPGKGDGLEPILAAEGALDDSYNKPWNKAKRWVAGNATLLSILLGALGLGAMVLFTLLARERPVSVPKHLPEVPDDASPALAYGLAHEGGDSTDTVLATLLDLVDRGHYEAAQKTTDDEKLDLALAVASKRPKEQLEEHERQVREFFDELLEGDTVALSEMRDRIPEHSSTWRGRWEAMTASLDAVDEGALEWDRDLRKWKWLLWPGLVLGFGVILACDIAVDEEWIVPSAIGLVTVLVVMLWPGNRLRRLTPETRERSARWRAFARWTDDFPSLEDDPPATLELWKRILVFGVVFGTAERMIESGRIPAPVLESAGASWSTYYFSGGVSRNAFDGGSFGGGFASQVAPESSSGGGGGFSGGGGGASGGGGGGSW